MKTSFILLASVALLSLVLMMGCTTFGRISWRNTLVVFRKPDAVANRIVDPVRPEARLAALWVGHSTVLVQLDDKFILTDPVFTRYIGGISPRLVEPGIAPENLPPLSAVLVSHRHFDHLSVGSFPLIEGKTPVVLTPPGAAANIPRGAYKVAELSAWKSWEYEGLRVTAVPVQHTGGRLMGDDDSHGEAFSGFVVEYRGLTVFFAGDTAYDESIFRAIAARFPVLDLALMPIGPIAPELEMKPHHMNPAEALTATRILGAKHMIPIHFGTFINSLDRAGEVEAAFLNAVKADGVGDASTTLWAIGEQRVLKVD